MASDSNFINNIFSTKKLSGKALLNVAASLLDYGARIVVGFLLNPILVSGLGSQGFGIWQVLSQLISYAKSASGRPTQALKWVIANKQDAAIDDEKRRIVGCALTIWAIFLPLLIGIGGLLAWYAPAWMDVPADMVTIVRVTAFIIVGNLAFQGLTDIPNSVLTGENLGYKRMGLTAGLAVLGGLLTASAIYLDTGLMGVATAAIITTVCSGVLFLYITRAHVPWFGVSRPEFSAVFSFGKLSGWFVVWNLIMKLLRSSDIVLLGTLASVEMVTVYTLTKYVPDTIIELVATLALAAAPGLGGIIGAGRHQEAAKLRSELMTLTWLIAIVVGTTVVIWNGTFVQLWVGDEYHAGSIPTLLIVVMAIQFSFIRNDAHIIDLTLNLRYKVLAGSLSVVLSMVLAIIMIRVFSMGISGVCLAFIGGRLIMSIAYPVIIGRFLGISAISQLKSVVRPFVTTVILLFFATSYNNYLQVGSWAGLVLAAGVSVLAVSVVSFYVGLSRDQRIRVVKRIFDIAKLAKQSPAP